MNRNSKVGVTLELDEDSEREFKEKLTNINSQFRQTKEMIEHLEKQSEKIAIGTRLYNALDLENENNIVKFTEDNKLTLTQESINELILLVNQKYDSAIIRDKLVKSEKKDADIS